MARDLVKKPVGEAPDGGDVFLREVDDAVREDELRNFGRRYGIAITVVILLGLAGLAGWIFWQNAQQEKSGVRSEEFVAALDSAQSGNRDGAAKALEPLLEAPQPGYAAAALALKAALALEKSDPARAVADYKALAARDDAPQGFRDLALIRQTAIEFDKLPPQTVIDRLKPLAAPDKPWFGSAGEMVAIAYLNMGKKAEAAPLFAELARGENVPATIKSRAMQIAGVQGIDVVNQDSFIAPDGQQQERSQ